MEQKIERVVIAGGGTAGWLAAAYLNRALGDSATITLVESSEVDPVGVGEATIPTLANTMRFLGFTDEEWMPQVQGTYKAAIKFAGWSPTVAPYYWHPFSARPEPLASPYESPYFIEVGTGFSLLHYALKERLAGDPESLVGMVLPTNALCEAKRSPIHPHQGEYNVRTAYHLDAGLLAGFLRKVATGRGVRQLVGHIEEVRRDDRGFIESLRTRQGQVLEGDLFIDCTGFRSVLLNGALEEPFVSDAKYLLCDAAVAIPCTSDPEREGIDPFTTSTAQPYGWTWDVPLMHRNGTGYVYSTSFLSPDEAERDLRAFLGPRGEEGRANHIKMRVGRARNMWVKNCVAVGLSGCFLEPLESTGIFLTEYALASLVSYFPTKGCPDALVRRYNRTMAAVYEELRDFIVLHYCINKRKDTDFWRAVCEPEMIPDTLKEKLAFFEHCLPVGDPASFAFYKTLSYTAILDGNGELPSSTYPILRHTGFEEGQAKLDAARRHRQRALAAMPSHYEYLKQMYRGGLSDVPMEAASGAAE